jgi:type VII secretion protein EssB
MRIKLNRTKKPKQTPEQDVPTDAETLVIKERKIDLQAKNVFEIYLLQHTSDHFLNCKIKEETEFFEFKYQVGNQYPISELAPNDWATKLSALIQIQHILVKEINYRITMTLDNFYIDQQGIVHILKRDLQVGEVADGQILKDFQVLTGTLLQQKYSYEQLYHGGLELLKENERTKTVPEWQSLEMAREALLIKQQEFKVFRDRTIKSVKKLPNLIMRIALLILSVTTIVFGGLYLYQSFWKIPIEEKNLLSERSFIEKDYPKVIETLKEFPVDALSKSEKYILAVSYIRSQSIDTFSNETKELILSKIVPVGTETVMDYWIYLGRLDAKNAEEIAMSLSDNQLLLYAYLQEMDNVSRDKKISGSSKAEKLNTLDGKIKDLADKLGIDYGDKKQEKETENSAVSSSVTNTKK